MQVYRQEKVFDIQACLDAETNDSYESGLYDAECKDDELLINNVWFLILNEAKTVWFRREIFKASKFQ